MADVIKSPLIISPEARKARVEQLQNECLEDEKILGEFKS